MNHHIGFRYGQLPVILKSPADPEQGDYQHNRVNEEKDWLHPIHSLVQVVSEFNVIPVTPVERLHYHGVGLEDAGDEDKYTKENIESIMLFLVEGLAFA